MTADTFADILIRWGLVDECAVHDPDGYDGGIELDGIHSALRDIEASYAKPEECCEWKHNTAFDGWPGCIGNREFQVTHTCHTSWKFCPHCGRKIKVEE